MGFFLGLAGLLLEISLGLHLREIPRSSPASPRITPSIPPLLLGLTKSEHELGGGEEEGGSGQLKGEGRLALPSQLKICCVGLSYFFRLCVWFREAN